MLELLSQVCIAAAKEEADWESDDGDMVEESKHETFEGSFLSEFVPHLLLRTKPLPNYQGTTSEIERVLDLLYEQSFAALSSLLQDKIVHDDALPQLV